MQIPLNLETLIIGVVLLSSWIILGWVLWKHIRPSYSFVAFFGLVWILYSIYTTETGKEINSTFDWVGAMCAVQMLWIEIGLVAKTVKEKMEQWQELYTKIKWWKK